MLKPSGGRLVQISGPWLLILEPSMSKLPGPRLTPARPLTSPVWLRIKEAPVFVEVFPMEASSLCRLLSQIYSAAVQAVLSGIKCFASAASLAKVSSYSKWGVPGVRACTGTHALLFQAEDAAGDAFVMTLDALNLGLYCSSLRCSFTRSPRGPFSPMGRPTCA